MLTPAALLFQPLSPGNSTTMRHTPYVDVANIWTNPVTDPSALTSRDDMRACPSVLHKKRTCRREHVLGGRCSAHGQRNAVPTLLGQSTGCRCKK